MNDFKKRNKFGGGEKRGGSFGARPSFRGGADKGFGRVELFQATCASCGKTCEVPFRPNGKKPVYCKECFAEQNGEAAPRRDFAPSYKQEYKPEYKPAADNSMFEVKKQLEMVNVKLDKLIQILGAATAGSEIEEDEEIAPKKVSTRKKK